MSRALLLLLCLASGGLPIADAADAPAEEAIECAEPEESDEEPNCVLTAEKDDDTLEFETETTVDNHDAETGLKADGDARLIRFAAGYV